MCYGNQTWSEESLMRVFNDDDLHGGQRSSEVKCGKLCAMATKLGQKNPWCKFMMMMTFMEVKRSSEVKCGNYVLWLPNLEETLVQVYDDDDDDDFHEGQRSSEVKCGKRCTLVTKLGQKESLMQVDDGDDLHEGQRSSEVKCSKFCTMVTKLGQKNR